MCSEQDPLYRGYLEIAFFWQTIHECRSARRLTIRERTVTIRAAFPELPVSLFI